MLQNSQDFFYKGNGEGDKLNTHDPHRQMLHFETDATGKLSSAKKGGYAYSKWPVSNPGMHGQGITVCY